MKIALIGYGKMGKEIEKIALEKGHEIVLVIDQENQQDLTPKKLKNADVAIEFTGPESAETNIIKCFQAGIPVVSGTTGWTNGIEKIRQKCTELDGTFFYASNFSLGVNIFFRLNSFLARIMNNYGDYLVGISETHHIHKKDSPSGTSITLADGIMAEINKKSSWKNVPSADEETIPIESFREGEVVGDHTVRYESEADFIQIQHSAKNRKGFAMGALMAAVFIADKKGVLNMDDLLNI
jgi:4-hydroxy-tetrahydrodipicolinate reductase